MLSKGASAIMFLRKGTFLGIGYICLCIGKIWGFRFFLKMNVMQLYF